MRCRSRLRTAGLGRIITRLSSFSIAIAILLHSKSLRLPPRLAGLALLVWVPLLGHLVPRLILYLISLVGRRIVTGDRLIISS